MSDRSTRREFLARSALLAAGVSTLTFTRLAPSFARSSIAEDLVDAGESFRRGSSREVALSLAPDGVATLRAARDGGVFTSRVLRSSISFTHVGLHWSATVPPGTKLSFEVRTSPDGSSWSPWNATHLQRLPKETPVDDYFASLVYARDARFVQYRATFRTTGGTSPTLQRVTATVIDSPTTAMSTASTTDQLPTETINDGDSGRTLAVTSREQWGANEKYRFNKRGREIWPEMFVPAKKLIIHHTATRNDYKDAAAVEVRAIYYYHAVTQRWGDIGYTALIDKFGNLYEGRHGRGEGTGREYLSAGTVAGHDYGHNYGSAGVALLGDATQGGWPMTVDAGPMRDALVRFSVFEAGRHYVRALNADLATAASSDFLRSDNVWTNNMHNVSGHRETNNTACPGDTVMALLDELRSTIHSSLADTSRTGVTLTNLTNNTADGRETTAGTPINFSWLREQPESGWTLVGYEYCFEGWYKPSNNINITYLSGYTAETQPRPAWTRVGPDTTNRSFTPTKAGQYTFHVRAVLRNDGTGAERRSAYGARHTYLVK